MVRAVRRRLLRTNLSLRCLSCDNSRKRKVKGITEHELVCPRCNSQMVAILHPMEMEREISEKKLLKSASLAKSHGARAALVIAGRGVGPDTAGRILRKQQSDDSALGKSIIEAEIAYATMAMITDYDCWKADEEHVTVEMVVENLNRNAATAKKVLTDVIARIPETPEDWPCHSALENAIMTDKKVWPAKTKKALAPILSKYL